jgi:hypothetical protein
MKMMYCIKCEQTVAVEEPVQGHTTMITPATRWDEAEYIFCQGPFEKVEPVEDPDWDLNLEEPNGDELFVMNMAAERLLLDLEGEYYAS